METHHVHGVEVGFHGGTEDAHSFLNHEGNKNIAQSYLQRAKEHGESDFIDPHSNQKFKITHQTGEDGKDVFSVEKSHHY